jgi:hypothetical protein
MLPSAFGSILAPFFAISNLKQKNNETKISASLLR